MSAITSTSDDGEIVLGLDVDDDVDDTVILVARDGTRLESSRRACRLSSVLSATLQDNYPDDGSEVVVPLLNVDGDVALKLVAYLAYHVNEPTPSPIERPLVSNDLALCGVCVFDVEFIRVCTQNELFVLLMTAHYLDVPSLLELCSASIATYLKGATPQQIRQAFNIRGDMTAAEQAELMREHRYLVAHLQPSFSSR
jgi:S-phase kinase-associated protein 1